MRARGGSRRSGATRASAAALTALALLAAPLLAPPGATAAPHHLDLGFGDPLFASTDASVRESSLDQATETGASIVRVNVIWSGVAPLQVPAGFRASDPGSAGYRWAAIDAAVRTAAADGLRVMFTVTSAPAWAEGPNRAAGAPAGTWRPQPAAYGEFASALATRYSGSFPDPLDPSHTLPRVRYFEAWNEPNLDTYLSPQWEGTKSIGPGLYRGLLNRFYAGVKRVQPDATVIAGSLAPFGDRPGGSRTPPVLFLRSLLCLRGGRLRPIACPHPARFDVLSDHPIAVGPPSLSAASPLDVTTPNLGRLTRVLRKAERTKRVRPAARKPLWVTEFWYDSDPPDPNGVPLYRQAHWYEQDLYTFWRQGARVAICLQLRDEPPGKSYAVTLQSGVFFLDGSPKPSRTALRFPLVARRIDPFEALVWGIAPTVGTVKIQARRKGRWRTLASLKAAGPGHPFTTKIRLFRPAKLRARIGATKSLVWAQD